MPQSIFEHEQQRKYEWTEAQIKLRDAQGQLLKNGSKLRRKDSGLQHSFIIIDHQILALSPQGDYIGKGASGAAKLAENESGHMYAVKIQRESLDDQEAHITHDLGISGQKATRSSSDESQPQKEYLACQYLGCTAERRFRELHNLSLDERYAFLIKLALEFHALHTGAHSKTYTAYSHNDAHWENVVIDEQNNPHLIDFGRSSQDNQFDQLKNKKGELINPDTYMLLNAYVYSAPKRRRRYKGYAGLLGDAMAEYKLDINLDYQHSEYTILLTLTDPKNNQGEYTQLTYTKQPLGGGEKFEQGVILLEDLELAPIAYDPINDPFPLSTFESVQEKILEAIQKNGHGIRETSNRKEALLHLANKGNATALEIAETLTLCRLNLDSLQERLTNCTREQRFMSTHILNSASEQLLALNNHIHQIYGTDSTVEQQVKNFIFDQIISNQPTDTVESFLTAVQADEASSLKEYLEPLVQHMHADKKCIEFDQALTQYKKNLFLLRQNATPELTNLIDTLQSQLMGDIDRKKEKTLDNNHIRQLLSPQFNTHDVEKLIAMISLKQLEQSVQDIYFDDHAKNLRIQANAVCQSLKALIESSKNTDDLLEITACILKIAEAVHNPTHEHITELCDMGLNAQHQSSPYWKATGVALLVLGATLLVTGIVIEFATLGLASPLAAGLAVGAVSLISSGAGSLHQDRKQNDNHVNYKALSQAMKTHLQATHQASNEPTLESGTPKSSK